MTNQRAYKEFIDKLVDLSDSLYANRVRQGFWQMVDTSDKKRPKFAALAEASEKLQREIVARNQVLESLDQHQRTEISRILVEERTGAIHDILAFLHGSGYQLSRNGVPLDLSPFGTEPHYDYLARLGGDDWPEE